MLRPYGRGERRPLNACATFKTPSSWKSTLSFSNHAKPCTQQTPPSAQPRSGISARCRPLYDLEGALARDATARGAMGSFLPSLENLGRWCGPRGLLFLEFFGGMCPVCVQFVSTFRQCVTTWGCERYEILCPCVHFFQSVWVYCNAGEKVCFHDTRPPITSPSGRGGVACCAPTKTPDKRGMVINTTTGIQGTVRSRGTRGVPRCVQFVSSLCPLSDSA